MRFRASKGRVFPLLALLVLALFLASCSGCDPDMDGPAPTMDPTMQVPSGR